MMENVTYSLSVLRRGAFYRNLRFPADSAPDITVNRLAEIKASLRATVFGDTEINLLTDELMATQEIDGEPCKLGIFRPVAVKKTKKNSTELWEIEAYDRSWPVKARRTETLRHIAAGVPYLPTIEQMLTDCGVRSIVADSSSAVFETEREDWPIGTPYLQIVNTLLGEIGFDPLWFDTSGFAHLSAYAPVSASRIKRVYGENIRRLPMSADYTETTDIYNAPNVFIGICDNADRDETLIASAENKDFGSKSILRRGIRIPQVTKVDQIADQESLQAYVDKQRDESMLSTQTLSFAIPPDGAHEIGDVIAIDADGIAGIYREEGWRLKMQAGQMLQITAKKTTASMDQQNTLLYVVVGDVMHCLIPSRARVQPYLLALQSGRVESTTLEL